MENKTQDQTATKTQPRFERKEDGWVKDRLLDLEWGPSSKEYMNFEQAEKNCVDLGGRLPTLKELQSLVDYEKYNPAIDKEMFPDTKSSWYWTGSLLADDSNYAWCVVFYDGNVISPHKDNFSYVRPVRASQ